jgi:hypothetical protein
MSARPGPILLASALLLGVPVVSAPTALASTSIVGTWDLVASGATPRMQIIVSPGTLHGDQVHLGTFTALAEDCTDVAWQPGDANDPPWVITTSPRPGEYAGRSLVDIGSDVGTDSHDCWAGDHQPATWTVRDTSLTLVITCAAGSASCTPGQTTTTTWRRTPGAATIETIDATVAAIGSPVTKALQTFEECTTSCLSAARVLRRAATHARDRAARETTQWPSALRMWTVAAFTHRARSADAWVGYWSTSNASERQRLRATALREGRKAEWNWMMVVSELESG